MTELYVAMNLAGLNHFAFNALFHGRDFLEEIMADGTGIAERMHGLYEFRRDCAIARDAARLDQHHALPGLAPLRVIVFVTAQRADERAGITFRPEAEIDSIESAGGRWASEFRNEGFGQAL